MKILIIGAGAIGIWVASQIRKHDPQASHVVTLLGRPRFVAAALAGGIQVSTPDQAPQPLSAITAIASLADLPHNGACDAIIVCTKTYSVPGVIVDLRANPQVMSASTQIVCFQNGVGSEDLFAEVFGADRIVAATTTVPVAVLGPSAIRIERLKGGAGVGNLEFRMENGKWLGEAIGAAYYDDWRAMKWSKLLLNIAGNASSAILGLPVGQIYANRVGFAGEVQMLRECLAMMRKMGVAVVDLPGSRARQLALALNTLPMWLLKPIFAKQVAKARGDKMPSFYYEVANHTGQCEVVFLNGAIAAYGQKFGVPTPINTRLSHILGQIIAGDVAAADWQGQIERLYAT